MDSIIDICQQRIQLEKEASKVLFHSKFEVPTHAILKNGKEIRKVRKRVGRAMDVRRFIGKSRETIAAQEYITYKLSAARNLAPASVIKELPINRPVWCIFWFYYADYWTKKGQMKLNIGDQSNLYQMPEDCLQKAGILANDAWISSHDLSQRLPSPDDLNWLEIFVLELPHGRTPRFKSKS
jgi:hypothetical protein